MRDVGGVAEAVVPGRVAEPGRADPRRARAWRAQAERDLQNARKTIGIGAEEVLTWLGAEGW